MISSSPVRPSAMPAIRSGNDGMALKSRPMPGASALSFSIFGDTTPLVLKNSELGSRECTTALLRRIAAGSISGILIELSIMPGTTQRSSSTFSNEFVAHMTMSAPATASCGRCTGSTGMPSVAAICRAKASRFAWLGEKQRIWAMLRIAQAPTSWPIAWLPVPMMPIWLASLRARYFTPSAPAAPTRMRWMMPSGMIASGSPVTVENSSTSPT